MKGGRLSALLLGVGVTVAVACGSDDAALRQNPGPAGEAGAADAVVAGASGGGVPGTGVGGTGAGRGGNPGRAGSAGSPAEAGSPVGGGPLVPVGGASGEGTGGRAEAGASGDGGAPSEPLFEDTFDSEMLETPELYSFNYVEFARWNVSSGSVDVTVLPNGYIDSPGGYGAGKPASGIVVDLNGSTNQDGTLETKQPLSFEGGVTYTLRYSLGNARNQSNSVSVSIAGLVTEMHTMTTVSPFTVYEVRFTPAVNASATLLFQSHGGADADGLLLDRVSIARQ